MVHTGYTYYHNKIVLLSCCCYATNVHIITVRCWFFLTVQWDDPPVGVCNCLFMGEGYVYAFLINSYFDNFIVLL
jgi:hypothetical protein